jgi:hypothetical protein
LRDRHLVIMLKEPRPGRVKTRLGREIGMTPAAWWFRHQTRALIRRLDDPRWRLWLAVSPDHAGLGSRIWPAHLPRLAQGRGDLGQRMARILRAMPCGPVLIIGGDIPGVQPRHIHHAFAQLGPNTTVLGPATDGGYWLIGMQRTRAIPATLFHNVRWSTRHAMADTIASLPGQLIGVAATLRDVDTAADLSA